MNELSNYIECDEIKVLFDRRLDLITKNRINYYPDNIDYLWVGTEKEYKSVFIVNSKFSYEPSFINVNLPVEITNDLDSVEKLDYYPNYANLTPKQRYRYLKYLENPFDSKFEIGYTFIFYYGLERFMYTEKYEGALNLIVRLLEPHNDNHSFVSYAVESILFKTIEINNYRYLNRVLIIKNVINTLFPPLRLYLYYITRKELSTDDIILLSKDVGWKKKTYLNEHKDLFVKNLGIIIRGFKSAVSVSSLINNCSVENLATFNVCRIANVTSDYKVREAKLPNLLFSDVLKVNILSLMEKAHNMTKDEVTRMRKNGEVKQKIITGKLKEIY